MALSSASVRVDPRRDLLVRGSPREVKGRDDDARRKVTGEGIRSFLIRRFCLHHPKMLRAFCSSLQNFDEKRGEAHNTYAAVIVTTVRAIRHSEELILGPVAIVRPFLFCRTIPTGG